MKAYYLIPITLVTMVAVIGMAILLLPSKTEAAITDDGSNTIITGNEISQSSTIWTVAATAQAGRLLVMNLSMDNRSTTDGQTSDVTSVTDSQGNVWTKAGEFTNTVGGVAADGATIAVWYSVLTTQLTTSDSVTTNYSGAVVSKAISVRKFTISSGSTVSVSGSIQTLANDNADAGSMTISSLTSGEYLFYRAISSETDANGFSANTANYTTYGGASSGTGGSEKGHVAVNGEYRIFTATGDSSDPTLVDTTADRASLYISFKETVAAQPASLIKPSDLVLFQ